MQSGQNSIPHFYAKQVREVVASGSSSFFLSFWFVSPEQAKALNTLYAFARIIDDCVDEPATPEAKSSALSFWETEWNNAWLGKSAHPVMQDIARCAADYRISRATLDGIVLGCKQDLVQTRYESYQDTLDYCYHVASLVGVACISIFGDRTSTALLMADKLGKAFQLTNIIRDVAEDFARGRIYLAREDLEKFGAKESDLTSFEFTPEWKNLLRDYIKRAQGFYDEAWPYLQADPHNCLGAARVMAKVYQAILNKISALDFEYFHERVSLTTWQKLRALIGNR